MLIRQCLPIAIFAALCSCLAGCTVYADGRGDGWDGEMNRSQDVRVRQAVPDRAGGPGALPLGLVGKEVRIQLRRDALGMSGTGVVGVNLDGPVRDDVSVTGVYRGREGDWLRLERDGGRMMYIPTAHVLAVETLESPVTRP